jgi:hypothetical protein
MPLPSTALEPGQGTAARCVFNLRERLRGRGEGLVNAFSGIYYRQPALGIVVILSGSGEVQSTPAHCLAGAGSADRGPPQPLPASDLGPMDR